MKQKKLKVDTERTFGNRTQGAEALAAAKRRKFAPEAAAPPKGASSGVPVRVFLLTIAAIVVAGTGLFVTVSGKSEAPRVGATGAAAGRSEVTVVEPAEDGLIRLAASTVDDGKARFYAYNNNGKRITFFVLKSSDGVVRAAFDACDVCYPARRGYRQEGDEMVCNNCGQRFPSTLINEVRGGCNPAPLSRSVQDGTIIIKASDIVADGARYF